MDDAVEGGPLRVVFELGAALEQLETTFRAREHS